MDRTLHFFLIVLISMALSTSAPAAKQIRNEGIPAQAPLSEYIGSKSCASCHQQEFDDWKSRVKSTFVRYRDNIKTFSGINWKKSPIEENDVFIVVGIRKKLAFVDKYWKVMPYEYKIKKGNWKIRKGWKKHNYDYRTRCGSCHTVAMDPATLKFMELGVGCESCHGPARIHAEHPTLANINVPGRNGPVENFCRNCHNSRKDHSRELETFNGTFHR